MVDARRIHTIRRWENAARVDPSPVGILEALDEHQYLKFKDQLRTRAKLVQGRVDAKTLGRLEVLYNSANLDFDRERWQRMDMATVLDSIQELKNAGHRVVGQHDYRAMVKQYAAASEGDPRKLSPKQWGKLTNDLVRLGVSVDRELTRLINVISLKQAIKLIGFLDEAAKSQAKIKGERIVTWEPKRPYPTLEQIHRSMSLAGGWTADQLKEWGVPWPPPKGWREYLEWLAQQEYGNL